MQQGGIEFNDSEGEGDRKGQDIFRGIPRDWLRGNERVSRAWIRAQVGKCVATRWKARIERERRGFHRLHLREHTFRGWYVVRPGFPDLFHNHPWPSVSPFSVPTIGHLRERPRRFPSSTTSYRRRWIRIGQPGFCSLLFSERILRVRGDNWEWLAKVLNRVCNTGWIKMVDRTRENNQINFELIIELEQEHSRATLSRSRIGR